jgi:uncharacterized membrane protein YcaP (DUF421 family)
VRHRHDWRATRPYRCALAGRIGRAERKTARSLPAATSVALGSTLATVLLSSSVALVEGITALALLVGLQYAVAWASARSRRIEALVKSEPTLVYCHGFLHSAMRHERITEDELAQAARSQGHLDLQSVTAVVIETDGSLSILTSTPSSGLSSDDQE